MEINTNCIDNELMLPPIFKAKHGFGMINIEQELTNADGEGDHENSGEASMTE